MGADGGSIPRRIELVQVKQAPERADQASLERARWFHCALSKEALISPVVVCPLGYMFNKTALLQALIEKNLPKQFKHIKNIKDVFDVNFKPNPTYQKQQDTSQREGNSINPANESPFICPVANVEIGPNHRFRVIRTCGCALSEKALKECPSDACLLCGKPFKPTDLLSINPDEEERGKLKELLKAAKKEKKKSRAAAKDQSFPASVLSSHSSSSSSTSSARTLPSSSPPPTPLSPPISSAAFTSTIIPMASSVSSSSSTPSSLSDSKRKAELPTESAVIKKAKSDNITLTVPVVTSVAPPKYADPNVFKSLFTSRMRLTL